MTKKTVPMGQIYFLLLFIGFVTFAIWLFNFSYLDMNSIKTLSIQNYGNWFIFATIISCILIAIEFYRNNIVDRAIWVFALFFCISSVVFLCNIPIVTHYYDLYMSITFFLSLLLVGLITTFFSSAGFVGVVSDNKKAVRYASLKLLALSIVCTIWSIWMKRYGVNGLTFMLWRWYYDALVRQLRGEKTSDWSFKW